MMVKMMHSGAVAYVSLKYATNFNTLRDDGSERFKNAFILLN
jgi:hypothetical protein